jgi:hypothetical protein
MNPWKNDSHTISITKSLDGKFMKNGQHLEKTQLWGKNDQIFHMVHKYGSKHVESSHIK